MGFSVPMLGGRGSGPNVDIHEWLLSATSGSSWIRRQWSDDVSLNDRYRLEAASQIIELRQAENDPRRSFERTPQRLTARPKTILIRRVSTCLSISRH